MAGLRKSYGISSTMVFLCFRPSSELSHSIFATAISHVSRTARSGWSRYLLRTGREEGEDIAPMASAAWQTLRIL